MPKLIITITERLVDMPGDPDRKLLGLETDFAFVCEPQEDGQLSALESLMPAIRCAIDVAQKYALGDTVYSASGPMDKKSEQIAIEKATAENFPAEIEA